MCKIKHNSYKFKNTLHSKKISDFSTCGSHCVRQIAAVLKLRQQQWISIEAALTLTLTPDATKSSFPLIEVTRGAALTTNHIQRSCVHGFRNLYMWG